MLEQHCCDAAQPLPGSSWFPYIAVIAVVGNGPAAEARNYYHDPPYRLQDCDPDRGRPRPASIVNEITVFSPASHPSLANILLRPFRRAQIARELQSLDERMLRDIGVTKSEIDRVAAESVGGEEWVVVALAKHLGRKLAAWSSRRDAYRRLTALDDRMLADIGLSRAEIPAVVKAMRYAPAGSVEGSFESESRPAAEAVEPLARCP